MTDPQIAGLMFGIVFVLLLILAFCWLVNRKTCSENSGDHAETPHDEPKFNMAEPKSANTNGFCPNCGAKLDPANNFCPNCGTPRSVPGNSVIKCPQCGSANIHFITSQGGQRFDKSDACCGYLLCGPLGLLCGIKDQDTKTVRKCMNCNHEF